MKRYFHQNENKNKNKNKETKSGTDIHDVIKNTQIIYLFVYKTKPTPCH